ncbi:unnamed protein product [Discula destructiva]
MASSDPFDDILHLEQKFYAEGHKAGVADGARAGRAEGRSFGLEQGFDKFAEAGRLYGKAVVWANRLPSASSSSSSSSSSGASASSAATTLPALTVGPGAAATARLEKNITALHALVEPDTLAAENTDEAVNDFDERVKRAQGKARVVERQVGEEGARRGEGVAPAPAAAAVAAAAAAAKGGEGERPAPAASRGSGVDF